MVRSCELQSKGKTAVDGVKAEVLAMQEEEGRRLRQEMVLAKLKARQEREEKYAATNSVKIHNQWRKVMRLAKVDELRKEVQIIAQQQTESAKEASSQGAKLDRISDFMARMDTSSKGPVVPVLPGPTVSEQGALQANHLP